MRLRWDQRCPLWYLVEIAMVTQNDFHLISGSSRDEETKFLDFELLKLRLGQLRLPPRSSIYKDPLLAHGTLFLITFCLQFSL